MLHHHRIGVFFFLQMGLWLVDNVRRVAVRLAVNRNGIGHWCEGWSLLGFTAGLVSSSTCVKSCCS